MRQPKYGTPEQRSRARVRKAQWARDDGIPDRAPIEDKREAFELPLKAAGYFDMLIEPRLGYVSWRAIDKDTGTVLHCAALKELLHWIADRVPRYLALRNFDAPQHYSARDEQDAAAAQMAQT
jgi:hypothetical protein